MKKLLVLSLAALASIVVFTGCTSIEYAEKFNSLPVGDSSNNAPLAHINVRITGMYLFGCLPIVTGSAASTGKCAGFSDNVTVDTAVLLLTRTARGMGGTRMYDIVSSRSGFPLLFFLSFDSVEVSGTVARPTPQQLQMMQQGQQPMQQAPAAMY